MCVRVNIHIYIILIYTHMRCVMLYLGIWTANIVVIDRAPTVRKHQSLLDELELVVDALVEAQKPHHCRSFKGNTRVPLTGIQGFL